MVLSIIPIGDKTLSPNDLINTTDFERTAVNKEQTPGVRTEYPRNFWPSHTTELVNMPLDLEGLPQIAAYAVATSQRPLEDYLDPIAIRLAYQAAFSLLLVRRLSDIFPRQLTDYDLGATFRRHDI